jgi:hypothetical protein
MLWQTDSECVCRATLEQVVEDVASDLKRHGISSSWPPENEPNKYPYTNNSVADFIDVVSS